MDTLIIVNCWGMSPVILLSHFQKINSIGQFSDLWQSALANFPGQVGEHLLHSKILQFASLYVFGF
jgi:hypothetical protein